MIRTAVGGRYVLASEFNLSAHPDRPQGPEYLAPLTGGGFVALWTEEVSFGLSATVFQRFTAEGEKVGSQVTFGDAFAPGVVTTADGGFAIYYSGADQPGGLYTSRMRIFDSSGQASGSEITVAPLSGARVTALAGGGYVALWSQFTDYSSHQTMRGQVYSAAGDKVGAQFSVAENLSIPYETILPVEATALPNGSFVVSWSVYGGYEFYPRSQIYDATGNAVGAAIANQPAGAHYGPTAALPGGNFAMAWGTSDSTGYELRYSIYDVGTGTWSHPIQVHRPSYGYSFYNITVTVADDTVFVMWVDREPTASSPANHISGQAFDLAGNRIGEEFAVSSGSAGWPSPIVLSDGTIVVGFDGGPVEATMLLPTAHYPVIQGSDDANTFTGTDGRDFYQGNGGNDIASGAAGADSLDGGAGDDRLDGGSGDDSLDGGDGDDVLTGGAGQDVLTGGDGADILFSDVADPRFQDQYDRSLSYDFSAEADTLNGGAGDDIIFAGYGDSVDGGAEYFFGDKLSISFKGAATGVVADFRLLYTQGSVTIGGATITGIEEVVTIEGSDFADTLVGASSTSHPTGNSIYGRGGNDIIVAGYYSGWARSGLWGGDGDDTIDLRGAAYNPSAFGEAGNDRIIGGFSDERLDGGSGDDTLEGNGGSDGLFGGDGTDSLDGGGGRDDLFGGAGNDILYGAGDSDRLDGGDGDDLLYGDQSLISSVNAVTPASNNDVLKGGTGNDALYGDQGDDQLYGGGDDDLLAAGAGVDQLYGEDGDDRLYFGAYFDPYTDLADGGAGSDQLILQGNYANLFIPGARMAGIETLRLLSATDSGFAAAPGGSFSYSIGLADDSLAAGSWFAIDASGLTAGETAVLMGAAEKDGRLDFTGGAGSDEFHGGGGDDVLKGAAGDDFLFAGAGNDQLIGGTGNDNMRGGAGLDSFDGGIGGDGLNPGTGYGDKVSFSDPQATQGAVADLRTGIISNDGFGNAETMVNVESLGAGTAFADSFYGNDQSNMIAGETGDTLYGFGGDDIVRVRGAAALADGGAGTDQLELFSDGQFYSPDSNGDGYAESVGGMAAGWTVNLAAGRATDGYGNSGTVAGFERVIGSALGDTFTGDSSGNYFDGAGGNDLFDMSGGGNDMVLGGNGNDYIYFGAAFTAADTIVGGAGTDTVALLGNYNLTLGAGTLSGVENFNLLSGTAAGGTEHVTYSITTVDANIAAGGRLTVYAGTLLADESLFFNGYAETDGALSVYGGAGNDTFAGGPANDAFVGGAGDDQMYGLGGMDWLEGGLGADQMRGGPGNDLFVYMSAAESTAAKTDHIFDFEDTQDHISLTAIDANSNVAGDQAFNFIGSSAFSHTAGELRAYQSGSDWFVEGDVDGDGNADLVIQVTTFGGHVMAASDFLL